MHQIVSGGGVQGAQVIEDIEVGLSEEGIAPEDPTLPSGGAALSDAQPTELSALSLANLLSIASGMLGDTGDQIAAVRDSVSLFSQVQSLSTVNTDLVQSSKCTFDNLEQSSQTSVEVFSTISSAKKSALCGVTPTSSCGHHTSGHLLSASSSIYASKWGCRHASNSRISQVAAVMSMVGAVNRMGNLVSQVLEDSLMPTGPLPSTNTTNTNYYMLAYQNLVSDTTLSMEVRSFMGVHILDKHQENICMMYMTVMDSALHCSIAKLLFDQSFPQGPSPTPSTSSLVPPAASFSTPTLSSGSSIPRPSSVPGLSSFTPSSSFLSGAQPSPCTAFDLDAFLDWSNFDAAGGGSNIMNN